MDEGEIAEDVIVQLRERAIESAANKGRGTIDDLFGEFYVKNRELKELYKKIETAQHEWNQVAEFLRAQGLKPDAPSLTLKALTPSATSEESETAVTAELVDEF